MSPSRKVLCILCQRSEETKITGPLSTKDSVTAHQNCLLYSSGIYCQNSPEFDDLFGFSVEDVKSEVKRGKKLTCDKCKKKGATAGCEIGRCKKSYHYPCAVQVGAVNIEDEDNGKYGLYCYRHSQQREEGNGTINSPASSFREPETSNLNHEAASSKVYCLACDKTEENISLESLSNVSVMLYCEKHRPSSHQRRLSNHDAVAGPSSYSSDSNSSKRQLSSNGKQEGTPSKRNCEGWTKRISDDSHSDEDKTNEDLAMFAPLESDLDESANSNPDHQTMPQFNSNDTETPTASISGNQLVGQSRGGNKDEDETLIHSDAESESLLLPVMICMESETSQTTGSSLEQSPGTCLGSNHSPDAHTAGPSGPRGGPAGPTDPPPYPGCSQPLGVTGSPLRTSSPVSPAPPENSCVPPPSSHSPPNGPQHSSPPSPVSLPSVSESSIDSASFWKGCNQAGCTQGIFSDFISEMNNISNRIQSDQASQEDYNVALRVMVASGKLAERMTKQQEELKKKQTELQKAAAAMDKLMATLRR
ncbi:uncharacterized protein phf11 isoform X1 [Centroberyx affinis]|uniref:uncharacterized protein phf11 isoform X1 n=1 Tax=Centroberyx affinis TaxID=166261 RepID=UPI003A5C60B2